MSEDKPTAREAELEDLTMAAEAFLHNAWYASKAGKVETRAETYGPRWAHVVAALQERRDAWAQSQMQSVITDIAELRWRIRQPMTYHGVTWKMFT
jgi:hypothetical protein